MKSPTRDGLGRELPESDSKERSISQDELRLADQLFRRVAEIPPSFARMYLEQFIVILHEKGYPKELTAEDLSNLNEFEFETLDETFSVNAHMLATAYNQNRRSLLTSLIQVIDWNMRLAGFVSLEQIFKVISRYHIPREISLTPLQQLVLKTIALYPSEREKEWWKRFQITRASRGLESISYPAFRNIVFKLRQKVGLNTGPIVDHYRLRLIPVIFVAWMRTDRFGQGILQHPYIRFSNTIYSESEKKLVVFGIFAPREHIESVLDDVANHPKLENVSAFFPEETAFSVHPRSYAINNYFWASHEETIQNILETTPFEYLENLSFTPFSPYTITYWHEGVSFEDRGERFIDFNSLDLTILRATWMSIASTNRIAVSPNAVLKYLRERDIDVSYKRIQWLFNFMNITRSWFWRAIVRNISPYTFLIYLEKPKQEVLNLFFSSLELIPMYAFIRGSNPKRPKEKHYLFEIGIPRYSSLPRIYHSFFSTFSNYFERVAIGERLVTLATPLRYSILWNDEEKSWNWDKRTQLTIK